MPTQPNTLEDASPELVELPAVIEGEEPAIRPFRGINIGGNTVVASTAHLPEAQRLLVRWLYEYARGEEMEWSDLKDAVKIDPSTLHRVWRDVYRFPKNHEKAGQRLSLDNVCLKIARFKRIVEARAGNKSAFCETSVWKRIDWLCKRAFQRQKIGFIFGESQIGKTTCLLEHQRRNNHGQTRYVEMPPSAGVQLMAKTIAESCRVSTNVPFERLITDICDALDEGNLLIVDEIHRVFTTYQKTSVMRCMDVIRYIHDKTKCGLVLAGTNVFRDEMRTGSFVQYLKQLERRGLYQIQLPTTAPMNDLFMLAEEFGLKGEPEGEALEVVRQIARQHGLGMFCTRLQDALDYADNKDEPANWDHFVKANAIIEKMARAN